VPIVLVVLVALIAIILIAPWHVDVFLQKPPEERAHVRVTLRWLAFSWPLQNPTPASRRARPSRRPRPRSRFGAASVLAALSTPGFFRRLLQWLTEMARPAWPHRLLVRGRVGLDDPSDTGLLAGIWYGLIQLQIPEHWDVAIEPAFEESVIEGEALARWSVRPLSLIWPMTTLAASPVVWRAGRAALRARRL